MSSFSYSLKGRINLGEATGIHKGSMHNEKLQGLMQQLDKGAIPHAILIIGSPSETGDTAQALSAYMLCQGTSRPCGECVSCRALSAGTHPDFYQMQSKDASARIKTAEIGELQAWMSVKPHYGERKVYVIEGIDNATPVAANRLLKTLEEPSQAVVAVMTATQSALVLPTIRSRCFQYALQGMNESKWQDATTSEWFAKNLGEDQNSMFAGFFMQMVQWTEAWVIQEQPSLVLADAWVKLSESMAQPDALLLLATWLRDLMHVRIGELTQLHFTKYLPQMNQIAPRLRAEQWGEAVTLVIQTRLRMKAHVALLLNIERMCIRLWEVMRRV